MPDPNPGLTKTLHRLKPSHETRFTNEKGAEIRVASGPAPDGGVLLEIEGPASLHVNIVTAREAVEMRDALTAALSARLGDA